jgi:cytochrome c553
MSPALLLSSNSTDLCLRCHATDSGNSWGRSLSLPGPVYGGGSFIFLQARNLNDASDGSKNIILGFAAGHSVVSLERGTAPDGNYEVSPGGMYPSASLQCTSCHDPHGTGGHFRLLYGSDSPASDTAGYVFRFATPAPDATGISLDGSPESTTGHSAYRAGIDEWCGNCHGSYHSETSGSRFRHPVGEALGDEFAKIYNTYNGTGFLNGNPDQSYLPAVPLEIAGATIDFRGPATAASRVTCLSCHRAHASSGPHSGRWDFNIATWADEGKISGSYPIPNPYESTAGPAQGRLCEKCHGSRVPG